MVPTTSQPGPIGISNSLSSAPASNRRRVIHLRWLEASPNIAGALEREGAAIDNNSLQPVGVDLGVFTDLFTFEGLHRIKVDLHVARHWRGYVEVLVDIRACSSVSSYRRPDKERGNVVERRLEFSLQRK